MATNYDLLSTNSTIQVLSPTLIEKIMDCVLSTKPSSIVFNYWVLRIVWDSGDAAPQLELVSGNIENIIDTTAAITGVGTEHLDASGLLTQVLTFTVAATAPGGIPNALTVDVDVPLPLLDQEPFAGHNYGLEATRALILEAYNGLLAAAAG